jgi:hypothetical protein
MRRCSHRAFAVWLAIFALVFMQAAAAAHACLLMAPMASQASSGEPCHPAGEIPPPACSSHCADSALNVDSGGEPFACGFVPSFTATLRLAPASRAWLPYEPLVWNGPSTPLSTRPCCLRI